MNKSHLIFFLTLSLLAGPLQAAGLEDWTIDDVLAKVAEANGGQEAVDKATNARFKGSIKGAEDSYDFILLKKRPNKLRMRLNMYKRSIENGYDGQSGWRRFRQDGYDRVIDLEGDELESLRLQADFDGHLVGTAMEGVDRRLVGIERIDRVDYFMVEVSTPLESTRHYIDSRTFRELKTVKQITLPSGESVEMVTFFHDLQRHEQIWVAHRVERQLPGGKTETILIEDVEINPGILDLAFDKPKEQNPLPGR